MSCLKFDVSTLKIDLNNIYMLYANLIYTSNYSTKTINIFTIVLVNIILTVLLDVKTLLTYKQFLAKHINKVIK